MSSFGTAVKFLSLNAFYKTKETFSQLTTNQDNMQLSIVAL